MIGKKLLLLFISLLLHLGVTAQVTSSVFEAARLNASPQIQSIQNPRSVKVLLTFNGNANIHHSNWKLKNIQTLDGFKKANSKQYPDVNNLNYYSVICLYIGRTQGLNLSFLAGIDFTHHRPLQLSFIILVLLLLATAIMLTTNIIVQKKLKAKLEVYEQERKMEKEKQQLSRELYENINTGLAQINLVSETLSFTAPHAAKELLNITHTSRKLIDSMDEMIWNTNPASNLLTDFFSYLRESLQLQLQSSGMPFHLFFPDGADDIMLTTQQRHVMLTSLKEVVDNAIKYSQATEIIFKAVIISGGLQFFVSDNGIGFDMDKKSYGNGIKTIQKQISDINGRLTITAEPEAGTHFVFFIPLNRHS
jgi:signal transduction histidine kinase